MTDYVRRAVRGLANDLAKKYPTLSRDEIERVVDIHSPGSDMTEDGAVITESGGSMRDVLDFVFASLTGAKADVSTSPEPEKRHANGFTDSEIAATKDPFRRYELASEAEGKCLTVESWHKNVRPVPMQPGDEKLLPEEKIARANEATFRQIGVIK